MCFLQVVYAACRTLDSIESLEVLVTFSHFPYLQFQYFLNNTQVCYFK